MLAFLLFGIFTLEYIAFWNEASNKQAFKVSFLGGLLLLCRHDFLTITILPVLSIILNKKSSQKENLKTLLLYLTPITIWTGFSLFYYGALLPNTAYAKVFAGVPRLSLIMQGIQYILTTWQYDPITITTIAFALVFLLKNSRKEAKILGLAILMNLCYVIFVGGDFMIGRFFSFSFLVATIALVSFHSEYFEGKLPVNRLYSPQAVAIALIVAGLLIPYSPWRTGQDYSNKDFYDGISDERGFYFQSCSLNAYIKAQQDKTPFPNHKWTLSGQQINKTKSKIFVIRNVGMLGYWAGTTSTIIDLYSLTDPFRARLPIPDPEDWRIGHFVRDVPQNYLRSMANGKNLFTDSQKKELYDLIQLACKSKELFSLERLKAIIKLNFS